MNIIEKADKYADGKANEAITKAIAQAYLDGLGMATMIEKMKFLLISGIIRQPILILDSQVEHFGQKTMRRMVILFSIFHMRERIIVRFLQRNNGKSC